MNKTAEIWLDEPDNKSWTDEATGLPCHILRNSQFGNLCGYVGVPDDHPWHGKCYSDSVNAPSVLKDREATLDEVGAINVFCANSSEMKDGIWQICLLVSCHGGLTFSGPPYWEDERATWWFGFDCSHAGDLSPKRSKLFPQDGDEYRDIEYVTEACATAARDLAKARGETA